MRFVVIPLIGKLLLHTAGVWGTPEQFLNGRGRPEESLIGKARYKKFPELSSSYFQPHALQKVPLGSPSASEMSREEDSQVSNAANGKLKVTTNKVESELPVVSPPMLVELRMPVSLQQIQNDHVGPLSAFLDTVQSELCKAGKLSNSRLQLVGIRGEYTRVPANQSVALSLTKNTTGLKTEIWGKDEYANMADQHVIVELEVMPGKEYSEPTIDSIEAAWKTQLTTIGSPLLHGPLGMLLKGASIQRPPPSTSSRLLLKNAFKSSVVTFHSRSWALTLFPSLLWIV